MSPCARGQAPELLQRHWNAIGVDYSNKRKADVAYRFQWPRRESQPNYTVVHSALVSMTDAHCAYCDGYPITSTGEEQIDHFCPKSWERFYELVCKWDILFLVCSACNKAKQDQWEEALLRPDEPSFSFTRYFTYRTDVGELEPNAAASPEDQHRAKRTIVIFNLNRVGACAARRRMVKSLLKASSDEDLEDLDYRYLAPLCRAV